MEQAFKNRLHDLVSTKNQNSQILTKSAYANMIKKVKEAKSKNTSKSPGEYQRLRRYDILEVGNEERLILPVKEDDLVIYYVHTDDVFGILNSVHLALKHGGRSRMKKEINKKYKNITQEMVMIYLSLCEVCKTKQNAKKDSGNTLWKQTNRKSCSIADDTWLDTNNVNECSENIKIDAENDFSQRHVINSGYEDSRYDRDFENGNFSTLGETGMVSQTREIDWNERLISAVQQKPGLYDKNHPARETLNKLWLEVFEVMIPNWNELSAEEKIVRGREMKDRWRNLRTCFRRELNKQRYDDDPEHGTKKRRKYVYYDQLMFLLPTMEDGEINSETDSIKIKEEEVSETEEEISSENLSNCYAFSLKSSALKSSEPSETHNRDPLKVEEVDEDKTFLLSLLPSFRRMEEEEKLEAKMEFLRIIKNTLQKRKRTEMFIDTRG